VHEVVLDVREDRALRAREAPRVGERIEPGGRAGAREREVTRGT
jgi:hypothetical protein